jgi:hypothetical protein
VAELFGQVLAEGVRYRQREEKADRRLGFVLKALGGLAGVLAVMTGVLLAGMGRQETSELQRRLDRYRQEEGKDLADRLHDFPDDLNNRLRELRAMRDDPEFGTLPSDSQQLVQSRIAELEGYIPYLEEVLSSRFSLPARTDQELDERKKHLDELLKKRNQILKRLGLPADAWGGPEKNADRAGAERLRLQLLDDIGRLRRNSDQAVQRYQRLYLEGVKLREFQVPEPDARGVRWRKWQEEVKEYVRLAGAADRLRRRAGV